MTGDASGTGRARDWDLRADDLAGEAIAAGEPTAWFERLYAEGEAGTVSMPWDRDTPQALLLEWTSHRHLRGDGRTAVVVGCGLGADAEHLAALGFTTTAFDVSPTAVRLARERHPDSAVDYRVADLLDLPAEWAEAFDLVVEVFTVQALPDPPRGDAVRAIRRLVASGGTLLAVAFRLTDADDPDHGPPFCLSYDDVAAFAGDGLRLVDAEVVDGARWRVECRRP